MQHLSYIGSHFYLYECLVYPTLERRHNLKLAVHSLLQGQVSAGHHLIHHCIIASCLEVIPNARLFIRPIQLHLLHHWSRSRMPLSHSDIVSPTSVSLSSEMVVARSEHFESKGHLLLKLNFPFTLITDASDT